MRVGRFILAGAILGAALAGAGPARAFDPLQRAERAVQRSRAALAAGDSTRAVEEMLKAQALSPDDPRIRHALGEVFYDTQQYPSAQRVFEGLLHGDAPQRDEAGFSKPELLYNSANAAFENQKYQKAMDLYTEALLSTPSGAKPSDDLMYNLELTQTLLESQKSSKQDGSDSQNSDDSKSDQDSSSDDSQSQDSENSESSPDSSQTQQQQQEQQQQQQQEQDSQESAPPDSTQASTPPDSLQTAGADSLSAPPPETMSREEAMRLLEALDQDEQELRASIQRRLRGGDTEDDGEW
jgi:tetratricopeptide (TPR) repeat protein